MIYKKYGIALLFLIILTIFAIAPAAAVSDAFATNITAGDPVYLGEAGLDISNILKLGNRTLAWYSSGSDPTKDTPSKTITLTDTELHNFYVDQARFGDYTGPWYAYNLNGTKRETALAFYVNDPSLGIRIYKKEGMFQVDGKKIVADDYVAVRIDSSFAPLFQRAQTDANLIDGRETFDIYYTDDRNYAHALYLSIRGYEDFKNAYDLAEFVAGAFGGNVLVYLNRSGVPGINAYAVTPDRAKLTSLDMPVPDDSDYEIYVTPLTSLHPDVSDYYIYPYYNGKDLEPSKGSYDGVCPVWRAGVIRDEVNVIGYKTLTGEYEFYAEININGMKDNLGEITGKTVSKTVKLTVEKESVKITADKETVIRNNAFSITIEGKPGSTYIIWITGVSEYNYDEVPAFIANQEVSATHWLYGDISAKNTKYTYKHSDRRVSDDLPKGTWVRGPSGHDYTYNYAICVDLNNESGIMNFGLMTTEKTRDTTYTYRVQKVTYNRMVRTTLDPQLYDTVKVKVEKGAVTVAASGDGSYYLGEGVTLSGTDTDSDDVFLFITGPNLPVAGGKIDDPKTSPKTKGESTKVTVKSDDTWEYKWDTSGSIIDAGTYTIYATSDFALKSGTDKTLSDVEYDTVSIVIKKPFVTATTSSSTVAKGDKLFIRGTAEGDPTQGVAVWILGKNYWNGEKTDLMTSSMVTETVNDDGSFEYELGSGDTRNLASGQYFVVVQHPMYNGVFDVKDAKNDDKNTIQVITNPKGANDVNGVAFIIAGSGKLKGSDAAEALITSINSANVDDTYTKLTFLVEEPWIRINSIGDHYTGDQFKITGTTNLAVDDTLIVEVTSSSFQPTQKTQSGEFSGLSSTVKVTEGSTYNDWALDVDSATFKADEYIVNVEAIEADVTTTTTFNILSGSSAASSSGQTGTGNTPEPTAVPTNAPVAAPAAAATASPGFEAILALIGLGVVAVTALRRD